MKAFLKIVKVLCYICSFPLFMVCGIIASMNNIEQGGSYGLLTYASVIVVVAFSVIWAIMVLVQELKIKKNTVNKAKKIRKQTTKQVIFSLLLSAGLMFILDAALPPIFPSLTSSTIYYEDIAESDAANNRADLNKTMLDTIVARSVMAGIIGDDDNDGYTQYYTNYKTENNHGNYTGRVIATDGTPLIMCKYGYYVTAESYNANLADADTSNDYDGIQTNPALKSATEIAQMDTYFVQLIQKYIDEGMKNAEVESLVSRTGEKNLYGSLNLSGYESWVGPWVDLANDSRMTIPVILNLVIGNRATIVNKADMTGVEGDFAAPAAKDDTTRYTQATVQPYPWYNPTTGKVETIQFSWNVLDMMGDYADYDPENLNNAAPALALDLSGTFGSDGLWKMIQNLSLLGIDFSTILTDDTMNNLLKNGLDLAIIDIPSIYMLIDSILNSVSYAVGNSAVAGTPKEVIINGVQQTGEDTTNSGWMYGFAPLTLKLTNSDGSTLTMDKDGVYYANVGSAPTQLGIYSNNGPRGTIDYMKYSWVDSNGLIFAITGLFAIRKTCYIFSAITVLMAVFIGAIRMKLLKLDKPLVPSIPVAATPETAPISTGAELDSNYEYVASTSDESVYQDPYMSAYQDSQEIQAPDYYSNN